MNQIAVKERLQGTLMREGAGVKLFRYIGADRQNPYEPFLLFDFFDSDNPLDFIAGFPPHPHRGFETVTYLLDGQIAHEDNHGRRGLIGPGDVQWMTAGKGIIHSEMPQQGNGRLTGLQLWLNLPAASKWVEPNYQEFTADELPVEALPAGGQIKVIAGETLRGSRSPIHGIANQPLFLDISLAAGQAVNEVVAEDHQALLFVLKGQLAVDSETVAAHTLAVLSEGTALRLQAMDEETRCLLITAKKLHEPIARLGPFVMNTQEEVMQALDDFRNQRF
ncbi:pirin family protein [Legionella taurinensis]|uniref:Pirin family protein n=1 Tax=Legionella taurinensis TaxID=70611 RepID=A0AB38N760_9GAMM|nr:pirin family protein [Legionella taurinensis]MDX1836217.1 pirin family protein [Legionella taurinensis]PUT42022.1 quercetin 2,3-dioxygenase [Legionella taurinensis]PUT44809.1 quercetin 2,3-dioxygenase [Legionella taurinensis]PUT48130.1 quercetin 2,3-dioxygenase [Legionella taurinensis]PUT48944.1 quercetin 2,3-dioxygenase [Legionella taurinensis]